MPSFFNGIFGHKPSKFIVSNEGQYPKPASKEQDSFLGIGPMCRYACDLKPILQVLADKNAPSLYLDEPVDLKTIKFYYQYDDGGSDLITPVDQDIKQALDKVVKHLKNTVKAEVNHVSISRLKKSAPIWFANMKSENQVGFDSQLANLDGKINVWCELMKTLVGKSDHTLVALLTCITEKGGIKYGTPEYSHYVEEKKKLYQEFRDMVGTDGVFLYPVHPTVAPYHSEPIVRAFNFSYTGILNILGVPATSIPLGLGVQGLPLGIQAVAGINQDRLCLAVAAELERAFGGWVPPEIQA
jgi:fatty acid amide hydrolase 2